MPSGLRQVIPLHEKTLNYFSLDKLKIFFVPHKICKIYPHELTCTINNVNDFSTAQSDITSLQESVNNNTTNITTLQSYIVSSGTNFGVRPDVFDNLTTRMQNTAIGNLATRGQYKLSTGSGNVMVVYNSGGSCESGSNNTFLRTNT